MTGLDLLETLRWEADALSIVEQTLLPMEVKYVRLSTVEEVWEAIRKLRVRGAPAIGLAAGFGMYLGLRSTSCTDWKEFRQEAQQRADYLNSSRPTAVNLRWAVERMLRLLDSNHETPVAQLLDLLLEEAQLMMREDNEVCQSIGRHGLEVVHDGSSVLTHCNAGGLVTARFGTALAPIYAAHAQGRKVRVFSDETRPLLQGARLTAFELQRAGVPVTLICDNMAATVMAQKKVDMVMLGADRVAANGDFANKIGTYGVAILAREHKIPFYCVMPLSTIDLRLPDGKGIPIEERQSEEITHGFGRQTAPNGVKVFNPAFDMTPHEYVTAFITEKGIVRPPFERNLRALFD